MAWPAPPVPAHVGASSLPCRFSAQPLLKQAALAASACVLATAALLQPAVALASVADAATGTEAAAGAAVTEPITPVYFGKPGL